MTASPWYDGEEQQRRRLAAGLNQGELADKVGRSAQLISHIETGRTQPSPKTAGLIATALGCEIADLMLAKPAVNA